MRRSCGWHGRECTCRWAILLEVLQRVPAGLLPISRGLTLVFLCKANTISFFCCLFVSLFFLWQLIILEYVYVASSCSKFLLFRFGGFACLLLMSVVANIDNVWPLWPLYLVSHVNLKNLR